MSTSIPAPPEPAVGTWWRNEAGFVTYRQTADTFDGQAGWGVPGTMPFAKWEPMWAAHGPLFECGPWGAPLPAAVLPDPVAAETLLRVEVRRLDGGARLAVYVDGVLRRTVDEDDALDLVVRAAEEVLG